jgi:hypothetical protein
VEDFSVSEPDHEEDIKRLEQNRLDAEKNRKPKCPMHGLCFLKTLKVNKVERFFHHRHTKALVNFGPSSPIGSFGSREKAPAVVSSGRFRVGEGAP